MKTGDRAASEARVRKGTWQALGWLSGLGLLVIPVFVAGVLSTAGGVLETLLSSELSEPQAWDAERTFPWLYVAALVVGLGWVTYGSVRIPGFRRGAIPGTAVALAVMGGLLLLGLIVQ